MRSWLRGVIGVLVAALVGWSCAAGSEPERGDSGTAHDAAADVEPGDGPAQSDVPVAGDAQDDGQLPSDGGQHDAQADVQTDGTPQQDGACSVQNTGACDVVCQNCGGQKCSMDPTNHQLAACMANGTVGPGGACTGDSTGDNCTAGYVCLSEGKCLHYCRTDGDCMASSGACFWSIQWGGTTPFKACRAPDTCNPIANTGCTTGGCFLWNNDQQTFCIAEGTGVDGTDCPNGNECKGGFVCVGSAPNYKCRQVCLKSAPVCSGAYTCQNLTGFTTYGFCA